MAGALRFRNDGTFTIVQFTDLHWQNGEPKDLRTRDLMERILEAEQPDLIVFTGDLIYAPNCRDPKRSLRDALAVAEESGIPWAAVFGNHDAEGAASRPELMAAMRDMRGCLAESGPADVHGTGNYLIRLEDRSGRTRNALYFVDTGALSELPWVPGYDWVRRDQIRWYAGESARLTAGNGGAAVPSLAFFHIPLPEYAEVWRTQVCYGRGYERPGCPRVNSGWFAAWSELADVVGAFCGHDHINDYGGKLLNTWLYYGRASGYQAYGLWRFARGARVIRLRAGEREFDTWVRLHDGRVIDKPPVHRPWRHWIGEKLRKPFGR
ncbi:metallophosphoesterase family protein [Cohnella caldifontis]|uniref:metallophosphoesterase family protein n=1 Tax=Cohnella caldifontis TaxID=3027471 RepID=UPI0023ED1F53|nr:metallophosphoesterase family protein [Cohnella sp. YIM B05605]